MRARSATLRTSSAPECQLFTSLITYHFSLVTIHYHRNQALAAAAAKDRIISNAMGRNRRVLRRSFLCPATLYLHLRLENDPLNTRK